MASARVNPKTSFARWVVEPCTEPASVFHPPNEWLTCKCLKKSLQEGEHQGTGSTMHASLQHVFVCVTFHWNTLNLLTLQASLSGLKAYPTNVTVTVICNEAGKLSKVLDVWSQDGVYGAQTTGSGSANFAVQTLAPTQALAHPHELAWVHREVFASVAQDPRYTLFMLLEEDMSVPFAALKAWASDTDLLRSSRHQNLQRGFYRTVFNLEGELRLSDAESRGEAHNSSQLTIGDKVFAQMPYPYCAMWVADKYLLSKFMHSPHWTIGESTAVWGVREMAAGSIQFVNTPAGFFSAWVVPVDPLTLCPLQIAAVRHGSNKGPHLPEGIWGRVPVCETFL